MQKELNGAEIEAGKAGKAGKLAGHPADWEGRSNLETRRTGCAGETSTLEGISLARRIPW